MPSTRYAAEAAVFDHRPVETRVRNAVKLLARSLGDAVTLRATLEEDVLMLDLIKVEPDERGRGLGTEALHAFLDLADGFGLPVQLQALSLPGEGEGPGQDDLEAWYGRHGFCHTGRRSVMGLSIMRREPAFLSPRTAPGRVELSPA